MAKNKKAITAIVFIAIIAVTVLFIGLIFKGKKSKGRGGFPGGFGGGFGAPATSVRTVVAANTPMTDFVTTNGEIETQTSIEVFPLTGGKVVQMNVSLGSEVKKGEIIGYIDPSEPGSYFAQSPITAPISGSIISSPVKTGQKVTANSVITKIGDIQNLQVTAKIPERYVAELEIGQKAEIRLEAYPDAVFSAFVVRISPVLDAATRTKDVVLNFDKADSRINAGMFAKVKLYTTVYDDYPIVRQDALVNNSDKYFLFIVNEDGVTVTKREVTLGKNVDGFYQITSGVVPGETMVTEGMLSLFEGAKIKDVDKPIVEEVKFEGGRK